MHGVLERLVGDRVRVELHLTSEPTWVTVDHTQLSRVVTNLAANARDAIDGDGRFTLQLKGQNLANKTIQQHVFGDILKRSFLAELRINMP